MVFRMNEMLCAYQTMSPSILRSNFIVFQSNWYRDLIFKQNAMKMPRMPSNELWIHLWLKIWSILLMGIKKLLTLQYEFESHYRLKLNLLMCTRARQRKRSDNKRSGKCSASKMRTIGLKFTFQMYTKSIGITNWPNMFDHKRKRDLGENRVGHLLNVTITKYELYVIF